MRLNLEKHGRGVEQAWQMLDIFASLERTRSISPGPIWMATNKPIVPRKVWRDSSTRCLPS